MVRVWCRDDVFGIDNPPRVSVSSGDLLRSIALFSSFTVSILICLRDHGARGDRICQQGKLCSVARFSH